MNVSAFLETFNRWASAQPDVKAVALVGSHARDAATEDSDVDLLILTTDVAKYINDRSWVSLFGEVAECRVEDWGKVTSLRTFYKDGLEVEYGFSTPDWAKRPMDAGSLRVVTDGMKILFDSQNILRHDVISAEIKDSAVNIWTLTLLNQFYVRLPSDRSAVEVKDHEHRQRTSGRAFE